MNTPIIRHFFDYHFAENRKIWHQHIMSLTQAQFVQPVNYSIGSIRDHIVHLISVDDTWFCGLRGVSIPAPLNPVDFANRDAIRARWDTVETQMREYLTLMHDDMLTDRPFTDDEDKDLMVWQVLLHVVNHGTDHRSQLLRLLNESGQHTRSQDYIFYVYDNP